MICRNEHSPDVECADCRGFAAVWNKLDDFTVPEVTPGFDARLYARIAKEIAKKDARRRWWYRLLWPPIAPVAIAAVAAVIMFVNVPTRPDASKQVSTPDIEQVAQAVDDLDLLTPLDK